MDCEQEKKRYISYCGSYCHTCDWHTGRIKKTARSTLNMIQEYDGFQRLFQDKVDINNVTKGLIKLVDSTICSGCKAETGADDRCAVRTCCSCKGYDLCSACPDFPCETLKSNPGVIRFNCIENLQEIEKIGLKAWIDKQRW